jgi:cytochrome b
MEPSVTHQPDTVKVWDLFVRFFHWSLVICVTLNLFILEEGEYPHQVAGYVACALIGLRLVWGFVGSRHARFSDFFPTPSRLRTQLVALWQGWHPRYVGHSPLGAIMMFGLTGLILALGLTGYMLGTDTYFGEEWLEELHEVLANTLMVAAGLHVVAAIVAGKIERVNLLKAMITGVKQFR